MPTFKPEPNEGKFAKIKPGRYKAEAIKWEQKQSKNKASVQYIEWTLKLSQEQEFAGRQVWFRTVVKGGPTGQLNNFLLAINPKYIKNSEFDADEMLNRPIEVEISYTEDKRTGNLSEYPSVIACYPYVSDIADFDNFTGQR